jgi:hypothetical protein
MPTRAFAWAFESASLCRAFSPNGGNHEVEIFGDGVDHATLEIAAVTWQLFEIYNINGN